MTASAETSTKTQGGKLIALTFDDGPSSHTPRLLDGLAERNVKATFFMVGTQVAYRGDTVRRVYREGHEVAQHSYNHPTLSSQSNEQVAWQIEYTTQLLNEALGRNDTYLLRPPYGDFNSRVGSVIGVPAIIWSIDPADWRDRNAYTVCSRIVNNAFDGAIILTHDTMSTTVDGVLMAIDELLAEGYEFVTVSELYRRRGVALEAGAKYYSCKPTGVDLGPIAAPTVELAPYYGGNSIRLSAQDGADIYYTTDGSDPLLNGKRYTEPLHAGEGTVIKACAVFDLNGGRGPETTYVVKLDKVVPEVAIRDGKIVLSVPNGNCDIFYTTDGSEPDESSIKYTAPIDCYSGALRFRAIGMGIFGDVQTIYGTQNGNLFWDVPADKWYFDEVDRAVDIGIFTGVEKFYFAPEQGMTRAMFVTVLYRLLGEPEIGEAGAFADVEGGVWYSDAMTWAAEQNIILGYDDGSYRPNQKISRQEMCVMLARLLQYLAIAPEGTQRTFADADRIAVWAEASVMCVVACGLMNGVEGNCFAPENTATRAQAAAVLLRLYDLLENS